MKASLYMPYQNIEITYHPIDNKQALHIAKLNYIKAKNVLESTKKYIHKGLKIDSIRIW